MHTTEDNGKDGIGGDSIGGVPITLLIGIGVGVGIAVAGETSLHKINQGGITKSTVIFTM